MRKFTLVLLAALLVFSACKKEEADPAKATVVQVPALSLSELDNNTILDADGNIVCLGFISGSSPGVVKVSPTGNILWTNTQFSSNYELKGITIGPDNNYYVLAHDRFSSANSVLIVAKLSPDGMLLNTFQYADDINFNSLEGARIITAEDGNLVITAYNKIFSSFTESLIYIMKITPGGVTVWKNIIMDNRNWKLAHLLQTADGSYLITGTDDVSSTNGRVALIKINEGGDLNWIKLVNQNQWSNGLSAVEMPNGNIAICGSQLDNTGITNGQALVVMADAQGNQQWAETWGNSLHAEMGMSVANTGNDVLGVVQVNNAQTGQQDGVVLRYNAAGNLQWANFFASKDNVRPTTILPTAGGFVITGNIFPGDVFVPSGFIVQTNSEGEFK